MEQPSTPVSPITILPHEIISYIFKIERDDRAFAYEDPIGPSLRMSQVSRTWRSIAISTATLWITLSTSPPRSKLFYEMLVERSNTSLLDIIIKADFKLEARARLFFQFAVGLAHRWRSLNISGLPQFHDFVMPRLQNLRCDHLEEFKCMMPGQNSKSMPIITGGTPRLVHWSAMGIRIRPPPLTALTSLEMNIAYRVSYSEWRSWLQCTSSTLLRLLLSVRFDRDDAAVEPIILPVLEVLEIYGKLGHATAFTTIFTTIIAPCAKLVTLFSSRPIPRSVCHIARLEQSYPQVLKLFLQGNVGPDVLRIFPTISVLAFITKATEVAPVLNSDQEGFSTLLPRLAVILGPPGREAEVRAFLAARSAAGMLVPVYRDNTMYGGLGN